MKICPQCRITYADDTLQFCLEDGARLVDDLSQVNETQTQVFPEIETVVGRQPGRIEIGTAGEPRPPILDQSQVTRVSTLQPQAKKSNTVLAVGVTALAMLVIFGCGIGGWLFLSGGGRDTSATKNNNLGNTTNSDPYNSNSFISTSPTMPPKSSPVPTYTPATTSTATPNSLPPPSIVDTQAVGQEVSNNLYAWKSMLESRNFNGYMGTYADRLDYYYTKGRLTAGQVKADKQRAFNLYRNFNVNISNMSTTVDPSGDRATVTFDKEWYFDRPGNPSRGKVRSQFQFTKINGRWLITGEKDLKVYYVGK